MKKEARVIGKQTEEPAVAVVADGQKRRSDLSTSELLRAAARLIAEKGYGRTSLVEIATEAGYSHGLVTIRFGSKVVVTSSRGQI